MVNDPIGDLIIQIKNASMAGKKAIILPYSRMKHAVADILEKEGYVGRVGKTGEMPKSSLSVEIKYQDGTPAITDLKRISKPGLRWYVNKKEIPTVVGGMGIAILSTPQGIMTGKEAKKRGIGGELLCTIW
jgi:small subunit ribosomal protein S8